MGAFSIAAAKAQLSAIVEMVEHGEAITLTKRGRPVAKIVPLGAPLAKPKMDMTKLDALRASMPKMKVLSVAMIRAMRILAA